MSNETALLAEMGFGTRRARGAENRGAVLRRLERPELIAWLYGLSARRPRCEWHCHHWTVVLFIARARKNGRYEESRRNEKSEGYGTINRTLSRPDGN